MPYPVSFPGLPGIDSEYYKILPAINGWSEATERIKDGKLVAQDFIYSSDKNDEWMSIEQLQSWLLTKRS